MLWRKFRLFSFSFDDSKFEFSLKMFQLTFARALNFCFLSANLETFRGFHEKMFSKLKTSFSSFS